MRRTFSLQSPHSRTESQQEQGCSFHQQQQALGCASREGNRKQKKKKGEWGQGATEKTTGHFFHLIFPLKNFCYCPGELPLHGGWGGPFFGGFFGGQSLATVASRVKNGSQWTDCCVKQQSDMVLCSSPAAYFSTLHGSGGSSSF